MHNDLFMAAVMSHEAYRSVRSFNNFSPGLVFEISDRLSIDFPKASGRGDVKTTILNMWTFGASEWNGLIPEQASSTAPFLSFFLLTRD